MTSELDPVLHTALPKKREKHVGEYQLAQKLKTFSGFGFELWFDLNYLPGVPDIDLLLYSKKVGTFVCEVKNFTMGQIKSYSAKQLIDSDGKSRTHPVSQVRNSSQQIKAFHQRAISDEGLSVEAPFFQTTVIWPRITRDQWNKRFAKSRDRMQSESFVFEDDLVNARTFLERLANIGNHPLLGVFAPHDTRGKQPGMESLTRFIAEETKVNKVAKKSSQGKGELSRTDKDVKKYPFGETHKVMMTGAAGTGKTTFLQRLGLAHAQAGARVLYICYNQALATDVKQQFRLLRLDEEMSGHIDVYDQFALYEHLAPEVGHLGHSATAQDVILCLKRLPKDEVPEYDTLLLDEAQDLDYGAVAIAEYVATSNASWFVSSSKGQELFGFDKDRTFPCQELNDLMADAVKPARNRLFRGAAMPFLAGHIFNKYAPSLDQAKRFIDERVLTQRFHIGEDIQEKELPDQARGFSVHYLPSEVEHFKTAVKNIIFEMLQEVKESGDDANLMIVVFGDKSPTYPIAKEALREAKQRVHDLTIEANRRVLPPPGSVKIVKAMGSRGLTASHVLVLDFDYIQTWCAEKPGRPPSRNLGYVVLTRANNSTRVAVRSDLVNENVEFLNNVVTELRKIEITGARKYES